MGFATMTRGAGYLVAWALLLTACSGPVTPPIAGSSSASAEPPSGPATARSATATISTPRSTSTPARQLTATPDSAYVPEGFAVGPLGLLRGPGSASDILAFNAEADWQGFRQFVLESIWQANLDWNSYAGLETDATRLPKSEFVSMALAGEELSVGMPVRAETKDLEKFSAYSNGNWGPYPWHSAYGMYPADVQLRVQETRLDTILLQVLDPGGFQDYLGRKDWASPMEESFSPMHYDQNTDRYSCNAVNFSQLGDQLLVTIGNYSCDDVSLQEIRLDTLIGALDPALHEKWPERFRPDGLGVRSNRAASVLLGRTFGEIGQLSQGMRLDGYNQEMYFRRPDGSPVHFLSLMLVTIQSFNESWEAWDLFVFAD